MLSAACRPLVTAPSTWGPPKLSPAKASRGERHDLRVLLDHLDRTEIVFPPATGWFPEQAFTHHLSESLVRDETLTQEALATGQPLPRILQFFLKIATGFNDSDHTKEEWLGGIYTWEAYAP